MPYTVVIGVAMPTIIKDDPGSLDMRTDTGILMQNAEVIPWSMTGILLPWPLKYPMLLNNIQVLSLIHIFAISHL